MSSAPDHDEIFRRAVEEGDRRLGQSTAELVATGFMAGFTVVFGVVAQGVVHGSVEPRFGEVARVAGALAFGVGLVFLVVVRAELFSENFFDPAASAIDDPGRGRFLSLLRLWALTFGFNVLGGLLLVFVLSVDGTLPPGAGEALVASAGEVTGRSPPARFANAVAGGGLLSLLSFLLAAVDDTASRVLVTYAVGFVLAVVPLEHVVVTTLHLAFGVRFGAAVGVESLVTIGAVVTAGNVVGGLTLVLTAHVQALGARDGG